MPNTTIASAILGPLAVTDADRVVFPAGLYGFPDARDFVLVPAGRAGLCWLQSATEPALAFLLVDPFGPFPDYAPDVPDADLAALGGGHVPAPAQVAVFAVVTLGPGGAATANLRAPVLLDTEGRRGRQVVLPAERRGVAEPLALG